MNATRTGAVGCCGSVRADGRISDVGMNAGFAADVGAFPWAR
ncbi:hypothetical protein [Saccharothrix sp. ALI-22-I]|nr:hypothetical protein [Saccharothrix sp. ALI-22-I]